MTLISLGYQKLCNTLPQAPASTFGTHDLVNYTLLSKIFITNCLSEQAESDIFPQFQGSLCGDKQKDNVHHDHY